MTVSTAVKWPAVSHPPKAPLSATVARWLWERAVAQIPVRVTYPDGRVLGAGSPRSPEFEIVRPDAFFARPGESFRGWELAVDAQSRIVAVWQAILAAAPATSAAA